MLVRYVVCVAHDVCVVLGSSSMFLVSLLLCDNGRKVIIIILSQHWAFPACSSAPCWHLFLSPLV